MINILVESVQGGVCLSAHCTWLGSRLRSYTDSRLQISSEISSLELNFSFVLFESHECIYFITRSKAKQTKKEGRTKMASHVPDSDRAEYKATFDSMDKDGDQHIDMQELQVCLRNLRLYKSDTQVNALIAEVDSNRNGKVEFDEFMHIVADIKSGRETSFANVVKEQKKVIQVKGMVGQHSFAQEEMSAFAEHFNQCLGNDPDLDYLLPIDASGTDLCKKVADGVLLAKFINVAVRDTIDERALNKKKTKISLFQINENQNLVISAGEYPFSAPCRTMLSFAFVCLSILLLLRVLSISTCSWFSMGWVMWGEKKLPAASIGVQTVNIGATELIHGEQHPHIILGLVWQLVKIQLLNSVNLKNHPELIRLLEDGETLADLLRLPPEQLLLRWFNYHLKNSGSFKRVHNFAGDVHDSEAYTILLNQIAPNVCDKSGLADKDLHTRANRVLNNASKLNVKAFIKPDDIVKGNPRLNLAFTAAIFNQCPGLDPLTSEELEKAGLMDDDFGDSREERAFRMWINSLNLDGLYLNSLFEDCKDGIALLKVMDHVESGCVAWKNVEMKPTNKFKKVSNCNYAVVIGKQIKFSLVGIGGSDIVDGNKKLLLALVWQLMRKHTLKFLAQVQAKKFGGKEVTDQMVIDWANSTVRASGSDSAMASFKDPALRTGVFFLDLLRAVEPRIIDPQFVTAGDTEENAMLNARYAISLARKLGAVVFVLPEDLVEVKPKMILTFVASIMSISK